MTATTVTIPTLLWVLPALVLFYVPFFWAWRRYVVPFVRRQVVAKARRDLLVKGLDADLVDARIAEWQAAGWPDRLPEDTP